MLSHDITASSSAVRDHTADVLANSAYSNSRFLQGITGAELNSILAAATERRVLANSVVLSQDAPAHQLILLAEGVARSFYITQTGRKVVLLWLYPGDVFGGRAILRDRVSYLLSTETVKDSRVLVWSRNTIRELMGRHPRLQDNALTVASDHFAWFVASHLALASHGARERLAGVLVSLAEGMGRKTRDGVELDISNEELANAANVTLFTASRVLSEWRRNGALTKTRRSIVLCARERLVARA